MIKGFKTIGVAAAIFLLAACSGESARPDTPQENLIAEFERLTQKFESYAEQGDVCESAMVELFGEFFELMSTNTLGPDEFDEEQMQRMEAINERMEEVSQSVQSSVDSSC